jgi:AcrR family transcriptional regulator
MPSEGARREEILQTAAQLYVSSGFRTSLADTADAWGIPPGSLLHHLDSEEAIVVGLVHRSHGNIDRVAKGLSHWTDVIAVEPLSGPDSIVDEVAETCSMSEIPL